MKVKIEEKWVMLTEDQLNILNAMEAALNKFCDSTQKESISSGKKRDRKGIDARIRAFGEYVMGGNGGSQEYLLPSIERTLDNPVYLLRKAYIEFLNELVRKQKKSSKDTENNSLNSPCIVTRDVLIRFATLALSREENTKIDKHDGETIIKAMEDFCETLCKKSYLYDSNSLSEFGKAFSTEHPKWVECIKNVIKTIKLLRDPSTSISHTLNYLRSTKLHIMRQLVALFDWEAVESTDLSDDWINMAFEDCEKHFLLQDKAIEAVGSQKQVIQWDGVAGLQKQIVNKFEDNTRKRVEALYQLFNNTELLISVTSQLDLLISASGWVPIMTGAFKPSALAQIIDMHSKKCNELLNLAANDPLLDKRLAKGLDKYGAISVSHLNNIAEESCVRLINLNRPSILKHLLELMSVSIAGLFDLQRQLPRPIMDEGLLKHDTFTGFLAEESKGKNVILPQLTETQYSEFVLPSSSSSSSSSSSLSSSSLSSSSLPPPGKTKEPISGFVDEGIEPPEKKAKTNEPTTPINSFENVFSRGSPGTPSRFQFSGDFSPEVTQSLPGIPKNTTTANSSKSEAPKPFG